MNRLVLIGAGGHARSIIDLVESTNAWEIIGLIGQSHEIGSFVLNYPVLGTDSILEDVYKDCSHALLSIGQLTSSNLRRRLVSSLSDIGFDFPVIVSPHAVVSTHASLGDGTTVGHNCVINSSASIGSHCIINSCSLIEHDVVIDSFCHVSTGVIINGGTSIGSDSFIGSGSILREGLSLPVESIVSAGTRVMGWPLCK